MGKALGWSFITDIAAKAAVLTTTVIAVRALLPIAFGQFVGLSALAFMASWLWDAGISSVVTRERAAGRITVRGALRCGGQFRIKLAPLCLAAMVAGIAIVGRGHKIPVAVAGCFVAASLTFGIHSLILGILRGMLRFAQAGVAMATGRWCTALLSLLALPWAQTHSPLLVLAASLLIGEVVTLVVGLVLVFRGPDFDQAPDGMENDLITLRAALPFNLNGLLVTAYNRFDVVILGGLASATQLSLYAPASRIQDALMLFVSSIGIVAFPMLASAYARRRRAEFRALAGYLIGVGLAITVPAAVFMTVITPMAIRVLLGPPYIGAVTATRVLIWSLPLVAIEAPLLAALGASGRAAETTKVYAAAFLAALGLHLCLDWWAGATGGAIASLFREPMAIVVLLIVVKRTGLLSKAGPQPDDATMLAHKMAL